MVEFIRAEKIRTGQSEEKRTEIAEVRCFVYLFMLIKWFLDRVILFALEFYLC